MSAVIGDVFFRPLQSVQHFREFGGHEVTLVPRNAFQAQHRHLMRMKSGHDIQSPLAACHVVERRSHLCEVQRMPVVQDVCGRDGNDFARRRCGSRGHQHRVQRIFAIGGFAAVAL